jgi:hypothetical protein
MKKIICPTPDLTPAALEEDLLYGVFFRIQDKIE